MLASDHARRIAHRDCQRGRHGGRRACSHHQPTAQLYPPEINACVHTLTCCGSELICVRLCLRVCVSDLSGRYISNTHLYFNRDACCLHKGGLQAIIHTERGRGEDGPNAYLIYARHKLLEHVRSIHFRKDATDDPRQCASNAKLHVSKRRVIFSLVTVHCGSYQRYRRCLTSHHQPLWVLLCTQRS
jgi:hypothetical protein